MANVLNVKALSNQENNAHFQPATVTLFIESSEEISFNILCALKNIYYIHKYTYIIHIYNPHLK